MADVTEVTITAGVPTAGDGGVATIYALIPVAHDGADSGRPIKIGGYAKASAPTDVSGDADRVNAWFLLNGAQAVAPVVGGAPVTATARMPVQAGGIPIVFKPVALTTDTSAYANGDIIADTQQIDAALRVSDGTGVLESIGIFDTDDNTPYSFTIYLHKTSTSMGSENAAISITDANALAGIQGAVSFTSGDAFDLINGRYYFRTGLSIPLVAVSGTDDIYVSMVCVVGTPTHTATGITIVLGIRQD